MYRTKYNGTLREANVGERVQLVGWVSKKRNFGQLCFIDLRDTTGICQLVFDEQIAPEVKDVRNEYVIQVEGVVEKRKDPNPAMPTGAIEVLVDKVNIINTAKTTPLIIADETDALEDTRMEYRYLDLRRPIMQQRLKTRQSFIRSLRYYLDTHGFFLLDTPMLGKSTPEGARDYLVPSRVHPGSFYALPQSPQLYKQLLMIAGLDKYYQFARCFRDEDLRADRQTDFTQVDIETSFLSEQEIMDFTEEMLCKTMREVKGIEVERPFLKLTWDEAMNKYGSDKPDNRFGMVFEDLTEQCKGIEFPVFQSAETIKGFLADDFHASNKEVKKLTDLVKKNGGKGLVVFKMQDGVLSGPARKFFSDDDEKALIATMGAKDGDTIFIVADTWRKACTALGALRSEIARQKGLKKNDEFSFLWVVDFPMFEWSEEEGRYVSEHHPFTMPKTEDLPLLDTDPSKVKTNAYDIILNGYELGGGSMRIYDNDLQKKIFKILGLSDEDIQNKFGFFVDAFQYGTPPHGGLALGFDRVAMILAETDSIRDVIAFPKNAAAKCPMSKAPTPVDPKQLDELHIAVTEKE